MVEFLDIAEVQSTCKKAVNFMINNAVTIGQDIGWHQILGGSLQRIGFVGSAVGLLILTHNRRPLDRFQKSQDWLVRSQFHSNDTLIDGGWTTRLVGEFPILESTAWVLMSLVATHLQNRKCLKRGFDWIRNNQNDDGGWGSIKNQPSRTHLTCLALRTLCLDSGKHMESCSRGIEWLLKARNNAGGGWGERSATDSTIFHTADVLYTLLRSGIEVDKRILDDARSFLLGQWDPKDMWDKEPLSEQFDLWKSKENWFRIRYAHFPTPWVILALLEAGVSVCEMRIYKAINWTVRKQEELGYWKHKHDIENIYVWGIHDNTLALVDFLEKFLTREPCVKLMLTENIVVISEASVPLNIAKLFFRLYFFRLGHFLRKNWSVILLLLYLLLIPLLSKVFNLTAKEILIGLLVPFGLLILQMVIRYRPR